MQGSLPDSCLSHRGATEANGEGKPAYLDRWHSLKTERSLKFLEISSRG